MGNTMADNIGTIFGSTFLSSLMPFGIAIDVEVEDNPEVEVDVEAEEVPISVPLCNAIEDSSQVNNAGSSEDFLLVTG